MGRASGSVSQRNAAQGQTSNTYAQPSLRTNVRIPVELTFLKPEACKKIYSRLRAAATKNGWRIIFMSPNSSREHAVGSSCKNVAARSLCQHCCIMHHAFAWLPT